MRAILFGLATIPLFFVAPVLGIVALSLFCVAHVPYIIAWALRRTADGVDLIGDGVMMGSNLVYKGQDVVIAKREELLTAYRTLSAEGLAEKERAYAEAQAQAQAAGMSQAATG